jgi:hypothetical protein
MQFFDAAGSWGERWRTFRRIRGKNCFKNIGVTPYLAPTARLGKNESYQIVYEHFI